MSIAKELIDPDAEKVLRRLRRGGYQAYLVGGCVRDLLLGRTPKDFDIATSATPQEIKDLFRNCRIIGRRFRLAHIFFGQKIIETATFRTNPREGAEETDEPEELLIRRDNVFGTAEEDARRRDFTINGLFYDIESGEVIDYVGGLADLGARTVRTIGDPDVRFREDPVRILRAIKFASRLGFSIEQGTYEALLAHREEIAKCAPPRVLEEVYRLLRHGAAKGSVELLLSTGVGTVLAPQLVALHGGGDEGPRRLAWRMLEELDASRELDPSNALLVCILIAPFIPEPRTDGRHPEEPIEAVLMPMVQRLRVSRRDAERARQILLAQRRLMPGRRRRARPQSLVKRDYFQEALALYELLARARGEVGDETDRWRAIWRRSNDPSAPDIEDEPATPVPAAADEPTAEGDPARRRRRRRGGRRRRGATPVTDAALAAPDKTDGALAASSETPATEPTPPPASTDPTA
jgi:poly(A) polymerase